jgi:small-conductance mechanosensitive channel
MMVTTNAISMAQTQANSSNFNDFIREIGFIEAIQAAVTIAIAYWGSILLERTINWLSEKVPLRYRLSIKQSLPFWRAFLLGLASVILINLFLDLSQQNILAITGTVAVALGFAFKDYASSVIAGIIALFERPYQVGDRVTICEQYGEIINYGLRGVLIKTPNDNIVTIPHNKLWTDVISNANKGSVEAQVTVNFYFAHDVDVDRAIHILYRVAQTSKYTQLKLPIAVILDEKPWGTHFKLKCYPIDVRDEFIYQTDLIKRAKRAFTKAGMSYPAWFDPSEQSG